MFATFETYVSIIFGEGFWTFFLQLFVLFGFHFGTFLGSFWETLAIVKTAFPLQWELNSQVLGPSTLLTFFGCSSGWIPNHHFDDFGLHLGFHLEAILEHFRYFWALFFPIHFLGPFQCGCCWANAGRWRSGRVQDSFRKTWIYPEFRREVCYACGSPGGTGVADLKVHSADPPPCQGALRRGVQHFCGEPVPLWVSALFVVMVQL